MWTSLLILLLWPAIVISSYSESEIISNCPCDSAGSTAPCELPCKCKSYTAGRQCQTCKPGYYNLDRLNSDGCSKCFCFNRTLDCTSSDYGVEWVMAPLTDEIEYIPKWMVVGWNPKKPPVNPMHVKNYLTIADDEMQEHGANPYYWQAPKEYLGDQLYAYGNDLTFDIGYTVLRGDVSGFYTEDADVILQGGPHDLIIGYKWQKYDQKLDSDVRVNITVPLREQEWFKLDAEGRRMDEPVSREEFALITYNLKRMLIRARFHTDQVEGRIYNVQMGRAVKVERPVLVAKGTEKCNCPEGYTGLSCELCELGYRAEKSPYGVTCIECDCHHHSLTCDPDCICMHNTTGKDCSFCKEGFYGNPLKGTPEDCKLCNCPPESKCIPNVSGDDYKCWPCPVGYTGDKCDQCDYGYFGNPPAGIPCKRCQCAPNIDIFIPGACDPLTGQCRCVNNTWGLKCDECLELHWGNPLTDGCKPCNCNPKGSLSQQCNRLTGQCQCRSNYGGKQCDRCLPGFGNIALDCPPCDCDRVGSVSLDCDAETGECQCKPGVTGPRCSICKDEYYGFSDQGCKPCNCDEHGSLSRSCDKETGQCICRPGFKGRDCSQCLPRYVATPEGCINCDDGNCMTLLLDDLDYLFRVLNNTDLSSLKDLPLKKLNYLTGIVEGVKEQVEKYKWQVKNARLKMDNITYAFDIEAFVDILNLKAIELSNRAPQLVRDVLRVKGDANSLLKIVNDLIDEIIRIVDLLKNYTPYHFLQNIERILIEAEKILFELRKRNYKPNVEEAERELRKAMALLEKVTSLLQTPGGHGPLMNQLTRLTSIAYSVLKIVEEQVQKPIVQSIEHVGKARQSYATAIEAVNNATSLADVAQTRLSDARQLIEAARQIFMDLNILLKGFPNKFHQLHLRTNTLTELKNTLETINPQYKEEYVDACNRHADELLRRVQFLKGIFLPSEELSRYAVRAANVYQNIVDALNAAAEAARRAYNAAERAYQEAYPQGGKSLIDQVKETMERSLRLLELAKQLRDVKVPELERELHKKIFLIDKISSELEDSERKMELIIKELERLTVSFDEKTRDRSNHLDEILARLQEIHKLIEEYEFKIRNELLPKLERLKDGSPTGIENLTKLIEKARIDIRNSDKLACSAEYRWNKIKKENDQLLFNLKELRDRIWLAKQKASNIRVSLGVNEAGICIRSYQPNIQSSVTNQITLNYATKDEARNSLLFFIGSNTNQEYMAIEMVDRRIRFIWNLGGGSQTLEHPQEIETNDQGLTKDQQWFKIEVVRIGNVATLSVKRTPDGTKQDRRQITANSEPNHHKLDLDANSQFYIGGLPTTIEAPKELRSKSFSGCLYELSLDNQRIGLWNFKTNIGCYGCKEGASEPHEANTYQFRKEGYALIPQVSRYDPRKYLLHLQFKTFDKDALLFFAPNLISKDYIAITLEDGYLRYQCVAGGGKSRVELKSKNRYNHGQWIKVAAERDRLDTILSVDDEILEFTQAGTTSVLLDLSNIQLYYGGVTPNFTRRDWPQIQFKPFIGCMKDAQIDATPLYFLNVDSYGIEPGCKSDHLKTVTFLGEGHLELSGKPLKNDSELAFVFKTHQEDCILLLSTFEGQNGDKTRDSHYYSVAVVGGRLEARFNGGSGETIIILDDKVNDGVYHSVLLRKKQRKVWMSVDDGQMGFNRLERGSGDIEASESGGFFIGGIPDNMVLRGMAATKIKLKGSIKDLLFNNQFTSVGEIVAFDNAEFEREYDTLDRIDRTINKIDRIVNKEEEENEDDLKPLIFSRD